MMIVRVKIQFVSKKKRLLYLFIAGRMMLPVSSYLNLFKTNLKGGKKSKCIVNALYAKTQREAYTSWFISK
jgi:hypothetical protein